MISKIYILSIIFIIVSSIANCQLNTTDEKGLKQGHWIKKYPTGTVMYEGIFRDDHPVGEFKRYYETGILQSVMEFNGDGTEAKAVLYFPDGKIASKGLYRNQLKEGLWQFYSRDSSYVINEENYRKDKKEDLSVTYYPDMSVAEKFYYKENKKNGEWVRYYENGNLWLKAAYVDDKLNGSFESWYENGKLQISGQYRYDRRDGLWIFYDQTGNVIYKITYTEGMPDNREMDIDASNLIDELEKNKGSIPDPEKTGEMW